MNFSGNVIARVSDECPISITDGGIFNDGVSSELDEYRKISTKVRTAIAEMEEIQKIETGITSL